MALADPWPDGRILARAEVLAGLDAVHVPFKGGGPAVAAVLGGQIEVLSGTGASWPFIQQGRMKVLGVSSLKRTEALSG